MPRFLQHIWAVISGHFWEACPLCGRYFGGHEPSGAMMTSLDGGVLVCQHCAEWGRDLSLEFWKFIARPHEVTFHRR